MFGHAVSGGRSLCRGRPRCARCASCSAWPARPLAAAAAPRARARTPIFCCREPERRWEIPQRGQGGFPMGASPLRGPTVHERALVRTTIRSGPRPSSAARRRSRSLRPRLPACSPSLPPVTVCGHAGASISVRGSSPRRVPFSFFFRTVARIVTALKLTKQLPGPFAIA